MSSVNESVHSIENSAPSLLRLLVVDFVAAAVSAAALTPFVSIVDKSIIQATANTTTLYEAVQSNGKQWLMQPLRAASSPAARRVPTGIYRVYKYPSGDQEPNR